MNIFSIKGVEIEGIASCVPSNIVENRNCTDIYTKEDIEVVIKNTKIEQRRIVDSDVCASDLGYKAANYLLESLSVDKSEISGIVFLSQTPDYKIPFTSNILQHRLGLDNKCLCLDLNAGCNGFISGLGTSFSLMKSQKKGKILFIIAETMSKIVSKTDKATSVIFGDAASVLLLKNTDAENSSYFSNYSDGKLFETLIIPDGGYRNVFNKDSLENKEYEGGSIRNNTELYMDGFGVFVFTKKRVPICVAEINEYANYNVEDIDYFIFHQANDFLIQQFLKKLNIPQEKNLMNIDRFGNTSGVSIPLVITTELIDKKNRETVHCCGYGSGLAWGSAILNMKNTKILNLIEY